jgi:hemin uptake protein HemP
MEKSPKNVVPKVNITPDSDSVGDEPKLYDSLGLFGNQCEIRIRHKGETYRIRITRNGKLIMNK